ncbi:MAG TPA: 2TM domain-containing protein [Burkholderiales bacterium]|nr:2TM domain-containing protein [Burkholderiales bacterium]
MRAGWWPWPTPGSGWPRPAEPQRRATPPLPSFRAHALVFSLAASALIVSNVVIGGGWWSFWPLVLWGFALGGHYLVHKARTIDDAWVEERTEDVRSKSYDAGHIDAIKKGPAAPGSASKPPP